jgi:hypothetical protein
MQCFKTKERKNYAARDFSDKYDHALFKYQICEIPYHFFKKIKQILKLICI